MTGDKRAGSLSRRAFLGSSVVGATAVMAPALLLGCGDRGRRFSPTAVTSTASGMPGDGYFSRFGVDESVIDKVLGVALARGGTYADLFFQHQIANYLRFQDGAVTRSVTNVMLGCGVRVLNGDQTGFSFSEDLSLSALSAAAKTASMVVDRQGGVLPLSMRPFGSPSHYPIEVPWESVAIDRKIPLLERANRVALACDKRVVDVQVTMSDVMDRVMVATSEGRVTQDCRPMTTIYVNCLAEQGSRREENGLSYGGRQGFEFYTPARMDALAEGAVARTVVLFDAVPPPAGVYPVVLAPGFSGLLLHEAMGHGMEADFNRKGISVYANRIGKTIAPSCVTIVDDGTRAHGRGTLNIDDEGTLSQRTVLVDRGVLASYLHDRISASQYGVAPTGSGRRDCYRYPPVPRMRNTYMQNGPHHPEEILRSVKKGIYAETFINGQVRIGSGEFSFYLKNGYLIEDGKLTRPIKDANLIGFGPKVLANVQMVGNDLALYVGAGRCGKDGQGVPVGFGLPTIKCGGISVGGMG